MKKLLYIILLLILIGCEKKPNKGYSWNDRYVREYEEEYRREHMTMEEREREVDSLTAEGVCLVVYGADRNLDTIENGFHIIYTTYVRQGKY